MTEPRIENVIIEAVRIEREDHGIFTCSVVVSGDGCGGSFGGYALDTYDKNLKRRRGTAYGCEFIMGILSTLEVERWENLPSRPARILTEGVGGRILKIGHFLKDKWFDPEAVSKEPA